MSIVVNFYMQSEEIEDTYEELVTGVGADNPLYLSLQTGDMIILPNNEESEFVIDRIVKNLCSGEMDVYVSTSKDVGEFLEEMGNFANNTLKTMFSTLKANIPDLDNDEDQKEIINKAEKYLNDVKYEELDKDK